MTIGKSKALGLLLVASGLASLGGCSKNEDTTPSGTGEYTMYKDETADPPRLVTSPAYPLPDVSPSWP